MSLGGFSLVLTVLGYVAPPRQYSALPSSSRLAQVHQSCPTSPPLNMSHAQRNVHHYRAVGCNTQYEALMHCIGGCTWIEVPRKRAAFELQCDDAQVTWQYLGQGAFGFQGCGRTITYMFAYGRFIANHSGEAQ